MLGYDTPAEYERDSFFLGATIGRYANRIANASFSIDGVQYELTANEKEKQLHGGSGFHTKLWYGEISQEALTMHRMSLDLEDGYPGNLDVAVRFELTDDDRLAMTYTARSDRDTVCCMTNHSYFNLTCNGDILTHKLKIPAKSYTPVGNDLLPTGEILPVADTEYDFNNLREVGREDYDINLVLDDANPGISIVDDASGRTLDVKTTLPGLQLYVGGALRTTVGKQGKAFGKNCGLCLEPQFFPNSPNIAAFPSPILRVGEEYCHRIEYIFGTKK